MASGTVCRRELSRLVFLGAFGSTAVAAFGGETPDLTGVWKLRSIRPRYSEIWTVKQSAVDIRIHMDITDDQLGNRVLDFESGLDGKEHKQTVIGTPASISAVWDGAALKLEIKRQARPDLLLHNRRLLRLAGDGKRIESRTIQLSPPPSVERAEVFDRQ